MASNDDPVQVHDAYERGFKLGEIITRLDKHDERLIVIDADMRLTHQKLTELHLSVQSLAGADAANLAAPGTEGGRSPHTAEMQPACRVPCPC